MRLASIRTADGVRAAVLRQDGAVILDGYKDVGALLRDGDAGMRVADAAQREGKAQAFQQQDLRRPVKRPGAIVCVGHNYRAHILEMGRELPTDPTLFSKLPRALTDPFAEIELSAISEQMDYEGELAIVIGAGGRDVTRDAAWAHVAGLTVLNDVTARDLQRRTPQWFAGKTLQSSTPMGPWVVTPEELGDISRLELALTVNGQERQRAALGDLVFDVPTLIADLSRIVELEPGDVIATGTPGGVGAPTGSFLRDGDVVEVSIDGIGSISNAFRSASTTA